MSSASGLVTDTIEFSNVDGPGNRFVVFLQGCTFNCAACHNPYTINPCIDCGVCVDPCPSGALGLDLTGHITFDPAVCTGGDLCLDICPYDASPKARTITVVGLLDQIRAAAPFLSGVTVSGGEATMQAPFLRELFSAIRSDPHTAHLTCFVDSNGDAPRSTWDLLDPVMDAAMIDLKCLDPGVHRTLARAGNDQVLASIELLAARGKLHEVRLLMLPGLNDADDLVSATGEWLAQIDPTLRVKVIGYRHHGVRPTTLLLREPSPEQIGHYAALLGAASPDFHIVTI